MKGDKRKRGIADEIISKVCNEYRNSDLRADNISVRDALNKQFDEIVTEREQLRTVGLELVGKHINELSAIRAENGEWLYHLVRLGLDGKFDDVAMYARRIARRLEGSATASAIRDLLRERGVTGSPLRGDVISTPEREPRS